MKTSKGQRGWKILGLELGSPCPFVLPSRPGLGTTLGCEWYEAGTGRISSSFTSLFVKCFRFWVETFRYGGKQWDSVAAVYTQTSAGTQTLVRECEVKGAALGISLTVSCPQVT